MHRVAALLDAARGDVPDDSATRRERLLTTYEQLAHDLTVVYESDDADALERLGLQFNRILSFDHVRTLVRSRLDRLHQADPAAAPRLELEEARDLIAQQAGFKTWVAFLESVAPPTPPVAALSPAAQRLHQAAQDFVNAAERDPAALQRLNEYYARSIHLRGRARGNLAPCVRLPRAFFPGADKLSATFRSPNDRGAGRRLRKLGCPHGGASNRHAAARRALRDRLQRKPHRPQPSHDHRRSGMS